MAPRAHPAVDLVLVAVLLLFCAPLFIGLGGSDLGNDEANYSYSIDRILETGEWLTPRASPNDGPFLEKPPLKFWIVAGAIRSGLLPHDERGLRFVDALFGALAFVYVYLLGRWLAGPLCGFVAVLALVTFGPLVFTHGLRSNNMEAALVLAYSGGVYHFARWTAASPRQLGGLHPLAVGVSFVLAFMTKFVAALFLPLVCGIAYCLRRDAWRHFRSTWRDWIPAALVTLAVIPWFVYQHLRFGGHLWEKMVGEHVHDRFTVGLDPGHFAPWHFYFSQTWVELGMAGSLLVSGVGIVLLVRAAIASAGWLERTLLVWWLVPFALMSLASSKLYHYAYPFLPPLALAAGYAAARFIRAMDGELGRQLFERIRWRQLRIAPWGRWTLMLGGAVALAIGAWIAATGSLILEVGGVRLFRSSSVVRPLLIGAVLVYLASRSRLSRRVLAGLGLILVLPVLEYFTTAERLVSTDYRLRSVRDCTLSVQGSGADVGNGYYRVSIPSLHHAYDYYLRPLGPASRPTGRRRDERQLRRRLFAPGEQTPVIMSPETYATFAESMPPAVAPHDSIVIVLPGPYAACVDAAVAAGGVKRSS